MSPVKKTYRTVVRPNIEVIQKYSDYVLIERLSLMGTYSVVQMLPFDTLATLTKFYNSLTMSTKTVNKHKKQK